MQAWIAGETLPRTFTLLTDGSPANLTDCTVELLLTDRSGVTVPTTGDVSVVSAVGGQVSYAPDPTDLVVTGSPYSALWKVTNQIGQIGFFPGTGADLWLVSSGLTAQPTLTFQDLRKQVLRWLDAMEDFDTASVLDELVKQQLNDALMARVAEYPWPWLRLTGTLVVDGASLLYQLPGHLQRLLYVYSAVDKRHLTKVPDRMLQDAGLNLDGARPSGNIYQPYTLEGTMLRFLEPPRNAETLHLGYYRMPQPMVNNQDLPDLPFPHGRVLVWDSLLDLKSYAKDIDASQLWIRKQEEAVRNLYQAYTEGQTLGEMPQFVHPEWRA